MEFNENNFFFLKWIHIIFIYKADRHEIDIQVFDIKWEHHESIIIITIIIIDLQLNGDAFNEMFFGINMYLILLLIQLLSYNFLHELYYNETFGKLYYALIAIGP